MDEDDVGDGDGPHIDGASEAADDVSHDDDAGGTVCVVGGGGDGDGVLHHEVAAATDGCIGTVTGAETGGEAFGTTGAVIAAPAGDGASGDRMLFIDADSVNGTKKPLLLPFTLLA
jgi:hypothetical protein